MIDHMVIGIRRLKAFNCLITHMAKQCIGLELTESFSVLNRLSIFGQCIKLSQFYFILLYQSSSSCPLIVYNEVLITLELITQLIP